MRKFNLPEKEYFTKEEIASRWECDIGLVDHYICEGLLRVAIKVNDNHQMIKVSDKEILDTIKVVWKSLHHDRALGEFLLRRHDEFFRYVNFTNHEKVWPKFFYIPSDKSYFESGYGADDHWISSGMPDSMMLTGALEDFSGNFYFQVDVAVMDDVITVEAIRFNDHYYDDDNTFITREERDRFEQEHGIVIDLNSDKTQEERPALSTQGHNAYSRAFRTLAEILMGKTDFTAGELKRHIEKIDKLSSDGKIIGKHSFATEKTINKYLTEQ